MTPETRLSDHSLTTNARSDSVLQDWLPWSGGVCPVDPHTVVEYRLRFQTADGMPLVSAAGNLRWDHGRTPESAANASLRRNDIVAYRIKGRRHHG